MSQPVDANTTQDQIDSYNNTLARKYLANKEFIVSGTNLQTYVTGEDDPIAPYLNLSNRYYPTVAVIPNEDGNLLTKQDLGGYHVPSNLGASVYLTKDIIASTNTTIISSGSVYRYIDPTIYNKGRGLTLNDQPSIIQHTTSSDWIKAFGVSSQFDGTIINSEIYQKFIPYQSVYETRRNESNGVITVQDSFELWNGPEKDVWIENNDTNKLNWLQYFDLNERVKQLLITPNQILYSWYTDVFGNQYGLYKPFFTPYSQYTSSQNTGNLWVRTIDSTISVGNSALQLLYNKYINNTTIYSQLTSNNIKNFEVFFDTLVFELSGAVLYEKIIFDYDTYTIDNSLQTFLNITTGTTTSNALSTHILATFGIPAASSVTYYGGNWYDDTDKIITACVLLSTTIGTALSSDPLSSLIVPVLYEFDLNNPNQRTRVFPVEDSNYSEYIYLLNSINYIEAPVITYNSNTNLFLTTFLALSGQTTNFVTYKIST